MLGLFGTLDMGARSLGVQQEEMSVAGQNLANVSNTAYAEEQLDISESAPVETMAGGEGGGVQVNSISSSRDPLLDIQIQAEGSASASLTAQQSSLQNAEAYLDEQISASSSSTAPDSANGLASNLSNLFGAFQALPNDPSSSSLRGNAVTYAQQVAQQFNQVSSQLSTVQGNLNTSIKNDVASSNQDLSDIATLNVQIAAAQNSGGGAAQLVDQREQILENLSGYANISTTAQSNGTVDVSIGGVTMVSGGAVADTLQAVDPGNGNVQVREANGGQAVTLTGGSIEGELTARDGALADLQNGLNTLASSLITSVNGIYSKGYDEYGNTGQNLFTGSSASDIGVNTNVVKDPKQFQAAGAAGDSGDSSVALALGDLGSQNVPGLNGQTFSGYYANTVSNLGYSIATVNEKLDNSQTVTQMLTNERASTSGVSVDTEMTNLIQYQKAYEASAELISTLNQMLQTAVQMKSS
ncbi:MAG TPA: flagellar hook-associated protein FlgK [Verrucomicrobiae bacterium]|jgi:flagellar hook-associated protein 1 FlgK